MANALQKIRELILRGCYVEALAHCRKALSAAPRDIGILAEMAQLLAMPFEGLDDPLEAKALLAKALLHSPDEPLLHFSLGFVSEYGLSDHTSALRHYRRAHELDPANANVALALAKMLGAPGVEMEAEEAFSFAEQAVRAAPGKWEAQTELARLCWLLGRLGQAQIHFQAALNCSPSPVGINRHRICEMLQKIARGVPYDAGYPSRVAGGTTADAGPK